MEEILFIINPVAGGGKAKDIKDTIAKEMKNYNISFKIALTSKQKKQHK